MFFFTFHYDANQNVNKWDDLDTACLLVSYVNEFTNKMLLSVQNLIHSHFQQMFKILIYMSSIKTDEV